jgi:DNA topoisomerase I
MSSNGYDLLAAEAGLLYITDEASGYRRVRRGKGFSYITDRGARVSDSERRRIESLAIPPAWEKVWISHHPMGHVLATGYDNAGRKQYLYHPVWEEVRDDVKFERTAEFGTSISAIRKRVDSDLRKRGLPRDKVVALAVAVLDQTLVRVGNRRYAEENESYGLTTLTDQHVEIDGHHVHLEFEGKGGAENKVAFGNRRLATLISRCQELNGQTLFSYEVHGEACAIRSTDVNDYLSDTTGSRFTAKDMRTWGATTLVVACLAGSTSHGNGEPEQQILEAIDAAAEALGNTREVCRASYVHPAVPEAFLDGRLQEAWARSRRGRWLSRAESAANRTIGTAG